MTRPEPYPNSGRAPFRLFRPLTREGAGSGLMRRTAKSMSQHPIRSRKFKLLLLKDHRNAGREPGVVTPGSSDQEYWVWGAVERGSRREDIVDREIAVSRQGDGISDWRAKEGSPTNQRRKDFLPAIRPNPVAAGKK